MHHVKSPPGHVVGPTFHPMGPFASLFGSTNTYLPKTDYIYMTLLMNFRNGGGETRNRFEDYDNRREDSAGAILGCPFDSIGTIFVITR
jgi:hypothetical protein